jgi:hypothetical protein
MPQMPSLQTTNATNVALMIMSCDLNRWKGDRRLQLKAQASCVAEIVPTFSALHLYSTQQIARGAIPTGKRRLAGGCLRIQLRKQQPP